MKYFAKITFGFLTVWKFHKNSITQILCEINFWDSRGSKSTILTHLEALNFDFYEYLQFLKAEIYKFNKNQSPKNGKNFNFRTSTLSKFDFT